MIIDVSRQVRVGGQTVRAWIPSGPCQGPYSSLSVFAQVCISRRQACTISLVLQVLLINLKITDYLQPSSIELHFNPVPLILLVNEQFKATLTSYSTSYHTCRHSFLLAGLKCSYDIN
ncbi:hypothetical protein AMECASPLE_025300 [Ameca splendens]|uniref:Uncharacterized protein n=1 Tax=Ameca splendens TaxID=208324 RepID=A0ABV0Z370_9TELE